MAEGGNFRRSIYYPNPSSTPLDDDPYRSRAQLCWLQFRHKEINNRPNLHTGIPREADGQPKPTVQHRSHSGVT